MVTEDTMQMPWLFKKIDHIQLILFRIFFGLLALLECWGAIVTGWVKETFVDPNFTFPFFGFEWTQFLLGDIMYLLFVVLGLSGLCIAIGYRYRVSILLFSLGWSLVYFMQKSNYNNHYYLVMLIAWFMVFMPANRALSLDVRRGRTKGQQSMFNWQRYLFVTQLLIVYTFAGIAKLYPGWYNGQYLHLRLSDSSTWYRTHFSWSHFADLLSSENFARLLSWLGIGFDLLVIPLLLWKPTRTITFIAALLFHIFNSITLHIGIFPYFALALAIFCFPPELIRKRFGQYLTNNPYRVVSSPPRPLSKYLLLLLASYVLWQLYLPLRHHLIAGDVLWTEEGHRLAWRMMLRRKSGQITFYVVNKETGKKEQIRLNEYVMPHQLHLVSTAPDAIWQFAQRLAKEYKQRGQVVSVFAQSMVSVNGSPYYPFIDPTVDLAATSWRYFSHQHWILDAPEEIYKKNTPIPEYFLPQIRAY
ncbi:HTTM domain-containing protein [Olivibacter oleidegradans]|uniref:HTTM domain-containing protein n=1 Tax=Olivibacter oleidegradans TaxID=760123 RepID=A0ABV6HQW2_9SPHI